MNLTNTETTAHLTALTRHFLDLRDGTHGDVVSRAEKEQLFATAITLLDPVVRSALAELDRALLSGTGTIEASGLGRDASGGTLAQWSLSWPEQLQAGIQPVLIIAHYGSGFHHPHLRGRTVGEWPLNVFDQVDARAQLPTIRAIAAGELHNLVFEADYRIVPAIQGGPTR
jgi:hypothetical protein